MEMRPYRRIVLPLPTDVLEAVNLVSDLYDQIGIIQIKSDLYKNAGDSILNLGPECALNTFLDLECLCGVKDIQQHIDFAKKFKVSFISLDAQNSSEIFTAAVQTAGQDLMVMVSLNSNQDWKQNAATAFAAGIIGFVCDPDHVQDLRDNYLESEIMVRGIIPEKHDEGEEPIRNNCPSRAMRRGADYLIVEGISTATEDDVPEIKNFKRKSDPRQIMAKSVSNSIRIYT